MEPLALDDVVIRSTSVSDMENNVYLITARTSGEQVIIDAADDLSAIRTLVAAGAEDSEHGTRVTTVLTTHRHWDHVRALRETAAEHDARTMAGENDAEAIEEESGARIDERIAHGSALEFDGFRLEAIELRGHTPGSIAYVLADGGGQTVIFSGDSLFPGGPGKTWSPEDFVSLMDDLEERIFGRFGDEVRVLPGHGDTTTLGAERPQLSEWRERGW